LIELGAGFHPELTGRENIYFNGSMLGMSRAEINQKYKQIVEFSEVEKFIDTPVKFYSSGMYVRLAFSVAAHLNPDILVLDEVLAVGDASFQKKSLKKILETMQDGKTVVFVSHAMSSVRQLCTNGIMLDKGSVVAKGKIDSIIESYILENEKRASALLQAELGSVWEGTTNESDPDLNIYKTYITDENDKNVTSTLSNGKDYYINIVCEVKNITDQFNLGYTVWDDTGRSLLFMSFTTDMPRADWIKPSKGIHTYRAKIPKNTLAEGSYKIKIIASIYSKRWILDPDSSPVKISLTVRHADQPSPYWKENRGGLFVPIVSWDLKK
jgi:lipopolysaccharide transport system ATP-binding protein